jgi:hypothetical protein
MKQKRRESILWIEGAGFGSMLVLIWAMELLHVPQQLFSESTGVNLIRLGLRSFVIILVWTTVHLATRRLLKRLHHLEEYLRICAWCQKIGHDGEWMTMQQYMGSNFATKLTHGVCPECSREMLKSTKTPKATSV